MITLISIVGVALGVAALLAVLSITTGFENAFRDKVLGVNAHVLVLKYGREFRDYRDVLSTVGDMPEVAGIAPFSINEMMLTKGERRSVVLVKGVTPEGLRTVLDLPEQMIAGNLEGLRRPGSLPTQTADPTPTDTWQWLRNIRDNPKKGVRPLLKASKTDGDDPEARPQEEAPTVVDEPGLMKSYWEEETDRREAQLEAERRSRRRNLGTIAKPSDIEAMLGGL